MTEQYERELPADYGVEEAVTGILLTYPETSVAQVLEAGGADLFTRCHHIAIVKAVDALYTNGDPIEPLIVIDRLKKDNMLEQAGDSITVLELSAACVSDALLPQYLTILKDKALLRRMASVLGSLGKRCWEPSADGALLLDELRTHMADFRRYADNGPSSLTGQIREWVLTTKGTFLTTDVYKDFNLTTRDDKKTCSRIIKRLVDEGLIEPDGRHRGRFRLLEGICDAIDWRSAKTDMLDFRWPGGIERLVGIMPGNVAVIAGEPNAGKTAFLLNVVRMNMDRHEIHYFSSEMGASEMRKRLACFKDTVLDEWKFHPWERNENFADVIRPDAVNIIDYLEAHEDFYLVGLQIKAIFDRLRTGVAIIGLQKNYNTNIGRGGVGTVEKPRLYLSMKSGELSIVKGKIWAGKVKPDGLSAKFELINGAKFEFKEWTRN